MKTYRFFYHYNKQQKKMSVHFRKKCYIVKDIACFRDTFTKYNKTQPYLVMQGFCSKVVITNDLTAIIT
jgi:hypothetical protein